MVLFFVALVITILAAVSLGLVGLATMEYKTVLHTGQAAQLVQVVQSGIDAAAQTIDDPEHPDLFNNPDRFCGIEVIPAQLSSAEFGAGRFTVFSPRYEEDQIRGIRFGLTRESAKLNLEAVLAWEIESPGLGVQALQKLPDITPVVIDSILDWLDADDNPRPQGAEAAYYQQQRKTYRPRNAVPIALEELLLIRDVERTMLFGDDVQLSFGATQSDLRRKPAASDGNANPFIPLDFEMPQQQTASSASAWQFLLTPYTAEKMVNAQGIVRVHLNESNLEFLESQLQSHQIDTESVQFILAWRKANGNIDDPIDLLDAEIKTETETETLASPFSCADPVKYERFLHLLDETVTDSDIVVRGRINVNEAPQQVLEAVPKLTPERATAILERRKPGAETQRHAVWLLAEGIVDAETMKILSHRLTTGGDVYRIQVGGFFDGKPLFHRAEAVLDATVKPPRMVFYKDLTPLGLP
ncbi:MAG: general secretion pathway protein GspK [Planctomycetaceae bacterium]|jgi:type II secretory pathway component PulK|nr:general secretion pathway protein GspK [Planctomycetaceae bacterium]